jgi:hypothetical protein
LCDINTSKIVGERWTLFSDCAHDRSDAAAAPAAAEHSAAGKDDPVGAVAAPRVAAAADVASVASRASPADAARDRTDTDCQNRKPNAGSLIIYRHT